MSFTDPKSTESKISEMTVGLGERSYKIYMGSGLLNLESSFQNELNFKTICLISSEAVAQLYLEKFLENLEKFNINKDLKIIKIILPNGESAKNWDSLNLIFTELLKFNMPRKTLILALGGGVIGDIAGLAASLYQRGVPYIQIPTTLLAQVDSSVGGKTAINHPLGKNMIGAFYQPKAVLIDLDFLKTLPDREYFSGLAEVIKYGLIFDEEFFNFLENYKNKILNKDPEILFKIIKKSCEIKAHIVSLDERESGLRAILNFGHTYAHAIETLTDYQVFLHGEAVSMGMVFALRKSMEIFKSELEPDLLDRVVNLLKFLHLPTEIPEDLNQILSPENRLNLMLRDKKNSGESQKLTLILLKKLGQAEICEVQIEL